MDLYNNSNVRRQDRLLQKDRALQLLRECEFGFLAMSDNDKGYGIPINYVWDGDDNIYFHSAMQGRKIDILRKSPQVSFAIVGNTLLYPSKFTTAYESVIIQAEASVDISEKEKKHGVNLFLEKYAPNDKEQGKAYIQNSLSRTAIVKLHIVSISGKTKRLKQ